MTSTSTTLRPGLLVSLSARITGGVRYDRKDLDAEKAAVVAGEQSEITRWETTKVIDDVAEYDAAQEARNKARRTIASVCVASDFGLLCPSSREFDLMRAIEEARRIAREHNATARRSFVGVYTITGRIAADDAEAARAISSEVKGLLDAMQKGVTTANVKEIRDAANRARTLGAMLTESAQAKVNGAIEQARAAAREIVKRVEKSGEQAAAVVASLKLDEIETAKFAFLDLDEQKAVETLPVAAPSLDLAPEAASQPVAAPINVAAFDL